MADQPTREQFEAAAKKVAATAQPGLSREDFFKLVDKELGVGKYVPPEGGVLGQGRRSAAGEGAPTGNESKEPGTWGGGFLKGIREQFVQPMKGELERAAVPTTGADISNLLLPSEIAMGGVGPLVMRGWRAMKRGASEAPRYRDIPRFAFSELSDLANLPDETLRSRALNRLPLSKQQDFVLPEAGARSAPQARPSTPIMPPQGEMKDLPLWKQQQMLEQTGTQGSTASGAHRQGTPPYQVKPAPAPQVKPPTNKAQTLDEVLQSAVEDAINTDPADRARRASLAANPDITPGGPFKQTGMFPKSERLGQAGGYSSGRPGITPDRDQELHDAFMERMGMGQPNPKLEALEHPELAAERAAGQEPGAGAAQAPDSNPAVGSSSTGPSTEQPSAAMSEPKQIEESSPWLGDENWSSGAESGSPEALRARALHSYAGEMNQVPKVFQSPGIGDLLARILAEGRGK